MFRTAGVRLFQARSAVSAAAAGRRAFAAEAGKLKLTFATPYETFADGEEVDWVAVPGASGVFGVYPNHVPTISQLSPGVVRVSRGGETENYFVSGGFAFVHADSVCEVSAAEAVPVEDLDAGVAKRIFDESSRDLSSTSETAKANAEIGVEVTSAIMGAAGAAH